MKWPKGPERTLISRRGGSGGSPAPADLLDAFSEQCAAEPRHLRGEPAAPSARRRLERPASCWRRCRGSRFGMTASATGRSMPACRRPRRDMASISCIRAIRSSRRWACRWRHGCCIAPCCRWFVAWWLRDAASTPSTRTTSIPTASPPHGWVPRSDLPVVDHRPRHRRQPDPALCLTPTADPRRDPPRQRAGRRQCGTETGSGRSRRTRREGHGAAQRRRNRRCFVRRSIVAAVRAALGLTRPTLVSVGGLIERKGHHRTIEAMRQLPDFDLLIAGEGPERERLAALIATHGLG